MFVLWCLIQLAGVAAMAWSIALVMRGVEHDTLDDTAIGLGAAVFLGVFVVVRMVSRRVLHLAWGEVPGAFGWRSALRGDPIESSYAPAPPALVWEAVNAATTIVIGAWLVTLDDVGAPIRGVTVLGLGALTIGPWLLTMISEWKIRRSNHWIHRFDVPAVAPMLVWVILGAAVLAPTPISPTGLFLLGLFFGALVRAMWRVLTARLRL